ncbi:MAG: hypothetical protein LLG04_05420 [Parachlamydia sp.]|nr:hypothetical protein [Parachlamydia sp.]
MFIASECNSITGKFLYSDSYREQWCCTTNVNDLPLLNSCSRILILGSLAGITRCALAIIHMVGHAFAALIFWNRGHFPHIAKGGAEFVRGMIEALPVIGRIFAWQYEPCPAFGFDLDERKKVSAYCEAPHHVDVRVRFFVVKIYHPKSIDRITQVFVDKGRLKRSDLEAGTTVNLFRSR